MEEKKHHFEIDVHKRGANGFKRIDDEPVDIRAKSIPTESAFVTRLNKLLHKKGKRNND